MVGSNSHPQKRERMENEIRAWLDPDVLDCPVCFEPLTIPIFQCADGHLVCSFRLAKVSNKCPGPGCDLPIGTYRCFQMEKVLKGAFVPCRNAEFGCTNSVSYGNVSSHEKECLFSQCSCPNLECNYTGSYNNICSHFMLSHHYDAMIFPYMWGKSFVDVQININKKVLVLWGPIVKFLFVVQCFRDRHGVYVTVRGIPPSTLELKKFSYRLLYSVERHTLSYKSPEVKRFLEVDSQIPEECSMFVSNSLLRGEMLEMKLSIKKLNQE